MGNGDLLALIEQDSPRGTAADHDQEYVENGNGRQPTGRGMGKKAGEWRATPIQKACRKMGYDNGWKARTISAAAHKQYNTNTLTLRGVSYSTEGSPSISETIEQSTQQKQTQQERSELKSTYDRGKITNG